jgi:hypothetical protein
MGVVTVAGMQSEPARGGKSMTADVRALADPAGI